MAYQDEPRFTRPPSPEWEAEQIQNERETQKLGGAENKALQIGIAIFAIGVISALWYFLVPIITSDADRNIWSALVFGVTVYIALKWAASH